MNEREIMNFLSQVESSQINLDDLAAAIYQLPQFYGAWLVEHLQENELKSTPIIKKGNCVLNFQLHHCNHDITLSLEINFENFKGDQAVVLYDKSEQEFETLKLFKDVIELHGYVFSSEDNWWQKQCCNSIHPTIQELEQILADLKETIAAIKKRKDELEKKR